MSVLMRGVDMPKNCEECNFKGECRDFWVRIREAYTRPSWCPLVEVNDSEKPNNCETCKYNDYLWYTTLCDACCRGNSHYEPKTEPQIFICPIQNDYEALIEDEPQTDCAWGKGE